ncbi:DUF6527 family protein [Acidicapsa dinghuensis]|uniref:DUF6527 family protein n=1 Tax=Acidicapsa dinghuensis TaxID=2218256 RepID=A0ABW1ED72_9BACT|nr:DUF6527 family protein [Acidicapsa dinghuensis]
MARRIKLAWWTRLTSRPWRIVAEIESADEIPATLPKNGAVLVVARKKHKWIAFDCPCHLHHRILLNLDTTRYPHWRVSFGKKKRLTISPSVNSSDSGVYCHYFIREGKVLWAKD